VSGGNDCVIRVWKISLISLNDCVSELIGHENTIRKLVYLKGIVKEKNDYFASCSTDDMIKVWKAVEGVCIYSVESHKNGVCSLAFLNKVDDKLFFLASGGTNVQNTVKFWGVNLKESKFNLDLISEVDIFHTDSIRYLTFIMFNGKYYLISTSWDHKVNITEFFDLI